MRSSWLTVARNSSFSWLASSACRRAVLSLARSLLAFLFHALPLAHVLEDEGDLPKMRGADPVREDVEPALHRGGMALETERLAGLGDVSVALEPARIEIRDELSRRPSERARESRVGLEGGIRLEEAVVDRLAVLDDHLHEAVTVVDGLEERPVAGLLTLRLGHLVSVNENAGDLAVRRRDRLVDEVDEGVLGRRAEHALLPHGHRMADEWLVRPVHALEQLVKALTLELGKRFADRLTDDLAVSDRLVIRRVRELEHEVRPAKKAEEARRLLEESEEKLAVERVGEGRHRG